VSGDAAGDRGAAAPAPGDAAARGVPEGAPGAPGVEELIEELEAVIAQRDEYLALARAKQAEFENYRKQMMRRQTDHLEQAAAGLVEKLLPVLDTLDYGMGHGEANLAPLQAQLLGVLGKEGLERVAPVGEPFDPTVHEAVAHEPGEGGPEVVTDVLRAGYRWNGRLLRPAMVKVSG
jgi:molecular chaperone GrpE